MEWMPREAAREAGAAAPTFSDEMRPGACGSCLPSIGNTSLRLSCWVRLRHWPCISSAGVQMKLLGMCNLCRMGISNIGYVFWLCQLLMHTTVRSAQNIGKRRRGSSCTFCALCTYLQLAELL